MRKIKYLVAALLFGSIAVNANPVAVNTAQKVALNFYNLTFNANASNETLIYTERSSDGQAVYYVFNVGDKGFVIISAEDATIPVIGYSNEGSYVIPAAGNNIDFWMNKRKNEIITIRAQNVEATSDVADKWTAYINNTPEKVAHADMSSVSPLCSTTWDQSPYYNAMCPSGSVTGCVATAMAQIMKFWAYPSVGFGSWCYDDVKSLGYQENYNWQCATFDTSHYAWSAMPNNVSTANKEVAKLMYDCGVSVDMDYSPSGSGSLVTGPNPSAEYSYKTYFGYKPNDTGVNYSSYTVAAWEALLKIELNAGRPVQYMGTDPTAGGHSWVCDGYTTTNTFHMNWGWSGYDDGDYAVNSLIAGGDDFSEYLGAVIRIQPPSAAAVPEVSGNIAINVYPNPSQGEFTFEIPAKLNNAQLKIYNTIGQEVYSFKVNTGNYQINLGNQSAGMYLYRLLNENGSPVSTGKLILQ